MKNIITEMKNTLEETNSRLSNTEQCISNLDNRIMKITQSEEQKEKQIFKKEDSFRDLWGNIKHTNIHIIGVPEGEEREKKVEDIFNEIIAENFPNLKTETAFQVQESTESSKQDVSKETQTKTYHN